MTGLWSLITESAWKVALRQSPPRGRRSHPWRTRGNVARRPSPRPARPIHGLVHFRRAGWFQPPARARDWLPSAQSPGRLWLRGGECRRGRWTYANYINRFQFDNTNGGFCAKVLTLLSKKENSYSRIRIQIRRFHLLQPQGVGMLIIPNLQTIDNC